MSPGNPGNMEEDAGMRVDPGKLIKMKLPQVALQLGHLEQSHSIRSMHDASSPAADAGDRSSSSRSSSQANMADLIDTINQRKVGEGRSRRAQQDDQHTVCLVDEDSGRIKWIQPSGPRKPGEGIQDDEQGIVSAEATPSGGALLRITLLASGFVIGPAGQSVRDICKKTGADIKSWTDSSAGGRSQPTRMYVIEGRNRAVMLALTIVTDAVERYKELCDGSYCGESVSRTQNVHGIDFSYQPPPRNVVPYAAALKGQGSSMSKPMGTGRNSMSPRRKPEAVLYASQILENVRTCRVAAATSYNNRATPEPAQQQQQQQRPQTPPSHSRSQRHRTGSRPGSQLSRGQLPSNARAASSLHSILQSRQRADSRYMQEEPHASDFNDSQNSQDTEQDWPPGYAPPSTARQPSQQQHRPEEFERSPPHSGYAYASPEPADMPSSHSYRMQPYQQPESTPFSFAQHAPSRPRQSSTARSYYAPPSPVPRHHQQKQYTQHISSMHPSSPFWQYKGEGRPAEQGLSRNRPAVPHQYPSELPFAPRQPAETWGWLQYARNEAREQPGLRAAVSCADEERYDPQGPSSSQPHMPSPSHEQQPSLRGQDDRNQELWLDQIYDQLSAETSPRHETPKRNSGPSKLDASAPPVTPPLSFKQSPDPYGAWRVRQEHQSFQMQSRDVHTSQHHRSRAMSPISADAEKPKMPGLSAPAVSMRTVQQSKDGLNAEPPSVSRVPRAKSAAVMPDQDDGASDPDDKTRIPPNSAGGTCTAPAWVCGTHPLFL